MTGLGRALRAVAGIAIIVALAILVNMWVGQYKTATERAADAKSKPPTATPETSSTMPVEGVTVTVLVAEPLRATPGNKAKMLRMLRKGEKLLLVGLTQDNWLQARDSSGRVGYIPNDQHIARAEKK